MFDFEPANKDNNELASAILNLGADNPYDEELRICRIIMGDTNEETCVPLLHHRFNTHGDRSSLFMAVNGDLVRRKVIVYFHTDAGVRIKLSDEMKLLLTKVYKK